jgi:hypothetical protein
MLPPSAVNVEFFASSYRLIPSQFPPDSRGFRGFSGKASLFMEMYAFLVISSFPTDYLPSFQLQIQC